ncbi:hypothetical protein G7Y89_g2932 [Cudoniella acicularis]|uniref:Uncharacterized protein n=1 Tax=Cudoniella acicularis TaxID=354080 RepID=A0A8H4W5P0_9HELO|nr:hypothetical protein G7Y89_g2932 [Cudoniella acicularis]
MQTSPLNDVTPADIDDLLGQGLGYYDWEMKLKSKGWTWNENLKNKIIKHEFEYFKEEILRLIAEPNTAEKGKNVRKTNSAESVLKRLKGEEWAKGRPDEKNRRELNRRLLGKDAKVRSLQKYVKEWKDSEPSTHDVSNSARNMETTRTASQIPAMASYQPETIFSSPAEPSTMSSSKSKASASVYIPSQLNVQPISNPYVYGSTQTNIQGVSWNSQTIPSAPAHRTLNFSNTTHSTSNYVTSMNSSSYYNTAVAQSAAEEFATPSIQANDTSVDWLEPEFSLEEYDTGTQLEWMQANGDTREEAGST